MDSILLNALTNESATPLKFMILDNPRTTLFLNISCVLRR